MKEQILKIAQDLKQGIITETEAQNLLLNLFAVSVSLPFPDDYENVKDSYLDFMETAMMLDVNMQPMTEIVAKTDKATDRFAKYLLRQ
jgi:hypothetical protein